MLKVGHIKRVFQKNYFSFVFSLWTYGWCSFLKQIWNIWFSFSCKTFCWVVEISKEIEKIFAVSRALEISQIGEMGKPEKSWQILLFKRFYEIGVSYLLKKNISKWSSKQSSVSEIRNSEKMENSFKVSVLKIMLNVVKNTLNTIMYTPHLCFVSIKAKHGSKNVKGGKRFINFQFEKLI